MSYAIITVGGKQYRVQEGERLLVDRLKTDTGKTFNPRVLLIGGDGNTEFSPSTTVTARVVDHVLGEKVRIGKYRQRTGYKRHTGFRSSLTQIEIESIGGGAKRSAPAKKEAPARAEAPKQEREAASAKLPGGYADLTVAQIKEQVAAWSPEEVEAALDYERAHGNRKGALAALEARKDG